MTKKHIINEIMSSLELASSVTPTDISQSKRDYKMAVELYKETLRDTEEFRRKSPKILSHEQWQKLLCMTNFGLGFGEGLLDMKNKTYRGRNRDFNEIESIVKNFGSACSYIKVEPLVPYNHLSLGKSYGALGLAKEGKNMLENKAYWDIIGSYIAKNSNLK